MTDALRSKWVLTFGCFLSFFAFGFIDNLKGPILPELLHAEKFTMTQGGTFFLSAYIGFVSYGGYLGCCWESAYIATCCSLFVFRPYWS
jgi:fucose permease